MWETLKEVNMMNRYNLYFSKILPHTLLINHPAQVCSTEMFNFPSCSLTVPTNKIRVSVGKNDPVAIGSYDLLCNGKLKPKKADTSFTVFKLTLCILTSVELFVYLKLSTCIEFAGLKQKPIF